MTDANPSPNGSKQRSQVDLELEEILTSLGKLDPPRKPPPVFVPEEPVEFSPAPSVVAIEAEEPIPVPPPVSPPAQEETFDRFQTRVYHIIRSDKPVSRPVPVKPTLPKPMVSPTEKVAEPVKEQKEPDILEELLREAKEGRIAASFSEPTNPAPTEESSDLPKSVEQDSKPPKPTQEVQEDAKSHSPISPQKEAAPPKQEEQHELMMLNTGKFAALKTPPLFTEEVSSPRVALPIMLDENDSASDLEAPQEPIPDSVYDQRIWTVNAIAPRLPASAELEELPEAVEPLTFQQKFKKEAFEWGRALLFVMVPILLFFTFVVRLVEVDGVSMSPTLEGGQRLVISKVFYTPNNGDVVVTSEKNGLGKPLIKRVIATGGQTVDIDSTGNVLVNGLPIHESYVAELITDRGDLTYPVTVPEGSVFVMGDNRNHSLDSRTSTVGFIPEKELLGKVLLRIYPIQDFGIVK